MKQDSRQKNIERFASRTGRRLLVNGVKWKFVVGTKSVVAYSETGDRKCFTLSVIVGPEWDKHHLYARHLEDEDYNKVMPIGTQKIVDWLNKAFNE